MGLAAPKNRIKLSHDPNNTKWTNDKTSFGHKIMTSQGWQPGDHLGVKGAAHAEFHTDANFSHIRVAIKDDNLGLGAKIGSGVGTGECTGLDAFQNLLGRLNGRDEQEMEREQKTREDLKRAIYAEQKWGTIRFVRGGLLVGDKIQPLIDAEAERVRKLREEDNSKSDSEGKTPVAEKDKKSKKRKTGEVMEPVAEVVAVKVKKSKKRKLEQNVEEEVNEEVETKKLKRSKTKSESSTVTDDETLPSKQEAKSIKKSSKKDRKPKPTSDGTEDDGDESRRKQEKEKRKREKREKKERAKDGEELSGKDLTSKSKSEKRRDKGDKGGQSDSSRPATKESTPIVAGSSGTSTPVMQGRHAVRARNIAQKRLASMDVASLNQIFMIKT